MWNFLYRTACRKGRPFLRSFRPFTLQRSLFFRRIFGRGSLRLIPTLIAGTSSLAVAPLVQLSSRIEELDIKDPEPVESEDVAVTPQEEMPDAEVGRLSTPSVMRSCSVDAGAAMIPHPEKAHKNGEDAFFISESRRVLVVADGVGGWAELGVDPSLFSKCLCASVGEHARGALESDDEEAVREVVQRAYDDTCDKGIEGSSTVCTAFVYSDHIIACNLGDSGLRVVRNNDVIYRTQEQVHQFNFPFQLGSRGRGEAEHPQDATVDRVEIESGDIIVMGSDGLFDNIFDSQIVKVVRDNIDKSGEEIALLIATLASSIASDLSAETPFARAAAEHRLAWIGGKLDDITVVVAKL